MSCSSILSAPPVTSIGQLISLDISEAPRAPGVAAIITAADIPGHNLFGPIIKDEHLLVSDEITFLGDPVCIIAARRRAASSSAPPKNSSRCRSKNASRS